LRGRPTNGRSQPPKEALVKKVVAVLLAGFLASAFAQDKMDKMEKKDGMVKKDATKKDAMKKDAMKKDEMMKK
jgi:pentapeptide MXKDX repeat protein